MATQLRNLNIPFTDDFSNALKETDHIVDAIFGSSNFLLSHFASFLFLLSPLPVCIPPNIIFTIIGFSFSGPLREPFPSVITSLEETSIPITSVDAPSSWDIETGPPTEGPGAKFHPDVLVSLTAPKPLVGFFKGRHFVGGR